MPQGSVGLSVIYIHLTCHKQVNDLLWLHVDETAFVTAN